MNIPENNLLKNEIEEILKLCEEAIPEYGEKASYFVEGIQEQELIGWEEENGTKIPESYKEWLRFSSHCQIRQTLVSFYAPSEFRSDTVPEDLVVIGEMTGYGEVICFSKSNGDFVRFFEGKENGKYTNFEDVLKEVIRMLNGKSSISDEAKNLFLQFMKNSEKSKKGKVREGNTVKMKNDL